MLDYASLLLGGEFLLRCSTDDVLPNIPVSYLLPCHLDPEVLGLDFLLDGSHSQQSASWASKGQMVAEVQRQLIL